MTAVNWDVFKGKESEHNWILRDKTLHVLTESLSLSPDDSTTNLLLGVKNSLYDLIPLLHTARTQLSLSACRFFEQLGKHCCTSKTSDTIEPCNWEVIIGALFKVCSVTKKIVGQAGQVALVECFASSPPQKIVTALMAMMPDKNFNLRTRSMEAFVVYLGRQPSTAVLEHWSLSRGKFASEMEYLLTGLLVDAIPTVRAATLDLLLFLTGAQDSESKDVMHKISVRLGSEKWRRLRTVLEAKIGKSSFGMAAILPLLPPPPSPSLKIVARAKVKQSLPQSPPLLAPPSTDEMMFDAIEPEQHHMMEEDNGDGAAANEILIPMQKVVLNSDCLSPPKKIDSSPDSKIPIRKRFAGPSAYFSAAPATANGARTKTGILKSESSDSFHEAVSYNSSMELSIGTPLRNYNKCIIIAPFYFDTIANI